MAMTAIKRSLYRKRSATRGIYTISRMLRRDLRGPADYSGYRYLLNHFFTKVSRKSTYWCMAFRHPRNRYVSASKGTFDGCDRDYARPCALIEDVEGIRRRRG
jgi:hypothetical protein